MTYPFITHTPLVTYLLPPSVPPTLHPHSQLEEAQLLLLQYNNDEETRKRVEADRNATIQRHLHKSVKEALAPLYSKVIYPLITYPLMINPLVTSPN